MSAEQLASTSRTTLYVGIAVTVLLAISVAVAAARPDEPKTPQVATTKPAQEPAPVSPSAPATASTSPTGAPSAVPTTPNNKPGTTQVKPGSAPSKPVEPVEKGEKLTELKAPPERTIGMIVVPKDFTVARFSVTFTPYGWGPSGADGGRLVAKITKSTPVDPAAKALDRDFANRNATLWCSKALAEKIAVGGTYSGTIEVRRQGDTGVLVLTELSGS